MVPPMKHVARLINGKQKAAGRDDRMRVKTKGLCCRKPAARFQSKIFANDESEITLTVSFATSPAETEQELDFREASYS